MSLSWKRTFQNFLLIIVCGLKSFPTSVVAAENSLLPILGSNESVAPYQEFSLLNHVINPPKVLAGSRQKKRQLEIVQPLVQLANRWLDSSGQIEVTLADSITETESHLGRVNVLLPVWSTADQLLFLQGGAQYQYDNKEIDLGIGQRWLTAKAVYWGYNLFYDRLYRSNHRRLGLGIEQHSGYRTLCLNAYLPLSRWQLVDNGNNRQQPAFGVDLRWQQQLSRYPECCWRIVGEHYFADQLAANELQNKQPAKTAVSIGIDYTPFSLLNLGYSYQLAKGRQGVHQFQLSLVYRLGVPISQQLQSVRGLGESSDIYRLTLVQREKSIKLQQVAIHRDQKSPVPLHVNIFDKTEEQADDEPPNAQSISGQENPGCDQLQEISKSSQSASAAASKETPTDDATSVDSEKALSESPRCGSGENPSLESSLSVSVLRFPGLVPGNPPSKGRTGEKKPGYSKSFNVKVAPHKAAYLFNLREQRGIQEENAKENSAPFKPPTADVSLKVDRLSMDSCSTQATNLPSLSLESGNLEFSQESEWLVNSESESLDEKTPRSYGIETPAGESFQTPIKIHQANDLLSKRAVTDSPDTLTFGNTSSEINVNLLFETPDSSNFNQGSPPSSTAGEKRIDPSESSGMLPLNALAFSHGVDLSLKHSKRVSKAQRIKRKRNVKPAHFFLQRKKLKARELAVKVERRAIKAAEDRLVNGQNRLETNKLVLEAERQEFYNSKELLKQQFDNKNREFSLWEKKLEAERSILQSNLRAFDNYEEDQKQTRAQLAAVKRDLQTQQEELKAEKLAVEAKEQELNAVESELQQARAQLDTAKWRFQSQREELEAKERAIETEKQANKTTRINAQRRSAVKVKKKELNKGVKKRNVQQDHFFLQKIKLEAEERAESRLANGQNRLEAEKRDFTVRQQNLFEKVTNLQQKEAQFAADMRKQQEKIEAREHAVETKEQELYDFKSKLRQKETQLAADKQGLQTQQERLNAEEDYLAVEKDANEKTRINIQNRLEAERSFPLHEGKSSHSADESILFSSEVLNVSRETNNRKRIRDSDAPEDPLLERKRRKLNEEGNASISEISSEPSASTDTGSAIDIQTQQKSHQPSEQSSDDQTQKQSAGTSSGENRASNPAMDESTTSSNKFIVKINQLTQTEMKKLVEGKGYQFGQKSIEKIFEQRDNGTFIRDEAHFKQVVGRQSAQILQRIELDYTYSDTF